MPARHRERRARALDLGADLVALPVPVAQGHRQVGPVAEVAHRRHAGLEGLLSGETHAEEQRAVVVGQEPPHRVDAGVEAQMDVGVDQPGHEGGISEIDHIGIRREAHAALRHRRQSPAFNEESRLLHAVVAVEQPGRPKGERSYGRRSPSSRRR